MTWGRYRNALNDTQKARHKNDQEGHYKYSMRLPVGKLLRSQCKSPPIRRQNWWDIVMKLLVQMNSSRFNRIAGLEQETENLKKKLAACTRENQNLQEELSEAYHIKIRVNWLIYTVQKFPRSSLCSSPFPIPWKGERKHKH
ncbi:hypothetical protein KY284_003175 [Solanum tuberosum]|nr:hypothetical protein KY284_003175 [Solanum tuberosum]